MVRPHSVDPVSEQGQREHEGVPARKALEVIRDRHDSLGKTRDRVRERQDEACEHQKGEGQVEEKERPCEVVVLAPTQSQSSTQAHGSDQERDEDVDREEDVRHAARLTRGRA